MNKEIFVNECLKLNLTICEEMICKFDEYLKLLTEWNNKFNLTSIKEPNEIYLKHFYDSLCLVKTKKIKNEKINICDFGTGAGFPGLVLKIIYPNINLTLIESNNKKCIFLKEIINQLNLIDVEVLNVRTEEYGKNHRELYDIVTCRAVSKLKIILELAIPLLKVGGYFLPLKSNVEEEIIESNKILKEMDSKINNIISYELPIEKSKRNIIIIQKLKETNKKYPREYKQIIK